MSLSKAAGLAGGCPTPFLQEDSFPTTGGFVAGRFCTPIAQLGNITCCLPCPFTDWVYADGFDKRTEIANWVNVAAFFLTVYLLLSFAFLPVKWTHRHYLSVCLAIGVLIMELAFIIPLAAKPDQCFNDITPNDQSSDGTCATSGAFLLFGGWAVIVWVFCRALSLHLQICWEVVPGKKYFYGALLFGWGIPAVGVALSLSLTGVSYRFGDVCHINHKDGLQDLWGPLLAFAAVALVLQFITIGYCVQVYIRSLVDDKNSTGTSSSPPTYSGSVSTASARQTYRRVKRMVALQWRGAMVVLVIIGEVVFFSIVFVSMDNGTQIDQSLLVKATPWLECLFLTGGNKDTCLPKAAGLAKPEGVVLAVLITLGLSGLWLLVFLGRWSMALGWKDVIMSHFRVRNEFVSADARRFPRSDDPRTYEMLSSAAGGPHLLDINPPERAMMNPLRSQPYSPDENGQAADADWKSTEAYINRSTRTYVTPIDSYSSPRPPSQPREWDPAATHARSAIPLHGVNHIGEAYTLKE